MEDNEKKMNVQQRSEIFETKSVKDSIKRCMNGSWSNVAKIFSSQVLFYKCDFDKFGKNSVDRRLKILKSVMDDLKIFEYVMIVKNKLYVENPHQ